MSRRHITAKAPFRGKRVTNTTTTTIRQSKRRPQRTESSRSERSRNGPRPPILPVTGNEIIERGIPGFSSLRYAAKLTYYEGSITMSSGVGLANNYVFSTNGLYDPDITSTGHQPMAFDQLMLSFEHYVVTNAKILVNFRNYNASYPLSVAVSLNAGPTPTTDYVRLVENGMMVRTRLLTLNQPESMQTLVLPVDIAKFGSIDDLLDNPDYKGTISANPVEQSYFHISVWNPIDATAVGANIEVYIEYDAWFTEPRKNSPSLSRVLKSLIISEETEKKE